MEEAEFQWGRVQEKLPAMFSPSGLSSHSLPCCPSAQGCHSPAARSSQESGKENRSPARGTARNGGVLSRASGGVTLVPCFGIAADLQHCLYLIKKGVGKGLWFGYGACCPLFPKLLLGLLYQRMQQHQQRSYTSARRQ